MPNPYQRLLNYGVIVVSLLICTLLLMTRIPGMTILGLGPQWLLIWLVAWCVKRDLFYALLAALGVAWLHDSLTVGGIPSHLPGFLLVAYLTASWRHQKYLQEDFISLALLVFVMTFVAETVMAIQHLVLGLRPWGELWLEHQRIALTSAILSSLWAPVVCFPLVRWWDQMRELERQ